MAKKADIKQDELENVQEALSKSEAFIEKNQKQIIIGVSVIILIVLVVLGFKNYYLQPREIEAENEMSKSQSFFTVDSFKIAVEGNANSIGFKEIVSEYSLTKSGNLAAAYAGICYYKLGKYNDAINYLSQFDSDDSYMSTVVIGLTGDAYVELGDKSKALSYFEKAADTKNEIISPIYIKKAAVIYESQNKADKALKLYNEIKNDYPKSSEASDIDKYIARIQK
ncbi:MAG: tetratricopeptide repeat protein [Paludibacter sp.]|nr:tetratricopeptide repeat protein [Paludibacter sp.]